MKRSESGGLELCRPAGLRLLSRWAPSRPSGLSLVSQTRKPRAKAWAGRGTQLAGAGARACRRSRLLFRAPAEALLQSGARRRVCRLSAPIHASFALVLVFMQELAVRRGHFWKLLYLPLQELYESDLLIFSKIAFNRRF